MSDSSSSSGGIGFCGLLTILFIGLKLSGVPPAGDVTHSAPLGLRSFLLCPPLRVFSMGLAAKRLSVLEAL